MNDATGRVQDDDRPDGFRPHVPGDAGPDRTVEESVGNPKFLADLHGLWP